MSMFVGVDIGGTKIAVLVADQSGNEVASIVRPTNLDRLLDGVSEAIDVALDDAGPHQSDLAGIGVGIPGQVNHLAGEVGIALNLNISRPIPLGPLLSSRFGVPVRLENDVRLAALGASRHLQLDNLAYLNLGTGVSAGIILNGQLHRGLHGVAGEIGYVQAKPDGTIYENLISGTAITQQAQAAGLDVAHAGEVYQLAHARDAAAQGLIDDVSQHIALMIQLLLYAYDVGQVVIGGGVVASGLLVLEPVLDQLARLRMLNPLNDAMLTPGRVRLLEPGVNAGLLGGLVLAQNA